MLPTLWYYILLTAPPGRECGNGVAPTCRPVRMRLVRL